MALTLSSIPRATYSRSNECACFSACSSSHRTGAHPLLRVAAGKAERNCGGRTLSGRLQVHCIGWDPEGILGPPQIGHIARRQLEKLMQSDSEQKEATERQAALERERRRAAREARIVPETNEGLVEFFLETEAQEVDFEIARCRLRLNADFFSYLEQQVSSLRFLINPTQESEDRLVELEVLQKALTEGTEAYDKLSTDLVGAKARLAKILTSKDKRATLLEMVANNELDKSLLVLLDQNIATASAAGQDQASKYMEKVRGVVIKYISL